VRQGTKFELKEDWGETYKGGNPTIYVASIENDGGIYQIENVPQDVSFGQVQWSPVSDELVFVGWSNNPRRLGIIHCFNRPSAIYSIKIDREEILKSFKPQTKEAAEAKNKEQGTLEQSKQKPDTTSFVFNTFFFFFSLVLFAFVASD
jgi:acylaminoacyl-peptidase